MPEYHWKTIVRHVWNSRRIWVAFVCLLAMVFISYMGIWYWGNSLEITSPLMSISIVDRNGSPIGESTSSDGQRYSPVAYAEIPPIITDGLIALEDRSFRSHLGVSPSGIARSLWNNIQVRFGRASGVQWGSTLTMGLARNILGINRNRGWTQKIQEIFLAFRIEAKYSKNDILTEYLNRVHFGRLATGIGAASQAYFGKSLQLLTPAENVALLSIIRNPTQYDPTAEPEAFAKRKEAVITNLEERKIIDQESAKLIREEPLVWTRPKSELPYVTDFLKSVSSGNKSGSLSPEETSAIVSRFEKGGTLATSIDLGMTDRVSAVAESVRTGLQNRNVSDYAILVVDRSSMKVRVLIGGANYQGNAGQVNAVFAPRQVGSTMKPFTYLLGITEKWHSMSDTILDAPASYLTAEGNPYEPKNYSLGYRGTISLSEALAGSVNVPAVKIAQEVGVGNLLEFARSLGVTSLNDSADHYGLALTLGVGEISLWELMRGYTIFADQGNLRQFSVLDDTPNDSGKAVTKPEAVSQIVDTLTSHRFKSEEFPTWSALDFGEGHVFVKTGTSRNFRDNYALGFTERYMIGVWTGNKDGSNMRGVSGASGAGEIFAGIVNELGEADGKITSDMDTKPATESSDNLSKEPITITSPLNGTHYRKDSDTPADRQDVAVKYWAKASYERVTITLMPDGRPMESRVLDDGRIPIGKLPLGIYHVKVEGFDGGKTDVAEIRFEIE